MADVAGVARDLVYPVAGRDEFGVDDGGRFGGAVQVVDGVGAPGCPVMRWLHRVLHDGGLADGCVAVTTRRTLGRGDWEDMSFLGIQDRDSAMGLWGRVTHVVCQGTVFHFILGNSHQKRNVHW